LIATIILDGIIDAPFDDKILKEKVIERRERIQLKKTQARDEIVAS
jgi:hypothetical protein